MPVSYDTYSDTNVPSEGALCSMLFGSTPMEFLSSTLALKQDIVSRNGIRGTREHISCDQRLGVRHVTGDINLEPSYTQFISILQYSIGSAGPSSAAPTEIVPTLEITINKDAGSFLYSASKIGRLEVGATQGQPIHATVHVVSQDEYTLGTSAATLAASCNPYISSDVTLIVNGVARGVHDWKLVVDNHIDEGRFLNSLTLPYLVEQDRTTTLTCTLPYDATNIADLYPENITGMSAALVFADPTGSTAAGAGTTIAMSNVQAPPQGPDIPGKSELMLHLNFMVSVDYTSETPSITADQVH